MDCLAAVEFQLDGQWQTARVDSMVEWGGKQIPILNTPGLVHEGGRTQVIAEVFERYDVDGNVHPAYQLQLQSWPQDNVLWDPPINRCNRGNPEEPGTDACWRAPWLADAPYRMIFRSSRLEPILAMTSIKNMETQYAKMNGGVLFSLAGNPGPSQWILHDGVGEKNDQVDAITYEWGGLITDARGANGLGANCAGMGLATAYSNGNGGQMPKWDAKTGSLSYGISGLHYGPDGKVYRGLAEVFIPGPLARCLWKVDPRQTARMEVEVFGDGGEEVAGTKSIGYDIEADLVKMIAIDFTYSEKDVVARPTPLAAALGKKVCDAAKTACVTVDKARGTAKISLTKIKGAAEVVAVALRGGEEDSGSQVNGKVKAGKASLTVKLGGAKSQGQVWVIRTPSTYISSFQVG